MIIMNKLLFSWRTFTTCTISFLIFDNIRSTPLEKVTSKDSDLICQTSECIQIAKTFYQNLNEDVDPCDNFYEFACGSYSKRTMKMGLGSFDEVRQLTLTQLRNIIISVSDSDIRPLRMANEFYESCTMDESARLIGVRPIREKVLELGQWPLTKMNEGISWIDVISKSRGLGFFPDFIISMAIMFNPQNNSELLLAIAPPSLGLPTSLLQQNRFDSAVRKYMELMMLICIEFEALSSNSESSTVEEKLMEMEKLFYFEIQLAKISPLTLGSTEDSLSLDIITLKKLKEQYPAIDWRKLVQAIVGPVMPISDAEKIGVLSPEFMIELGILLEATPETVIVNYIIWRSIFFSLKIMFAIEMEPRWKMCTVWTQNGFSDVLGPKYVEKYFRDGSKQDVLEMVNRIKTQMKESLSNSAWIDNVTKERALDKLEGIVSVVGFSDDILNRDKDLINTYKNLHISSHNYYESHLNLSKFNYDQEISLLRQSKRKKLAVSISPASINAFYIPAENTIVIPAAILQSLFYSVDRPNYLNYGMVGFITGHELSHAFDNYGSHFDKYGNYKNWWQSETAVKYKERIKCFVNQYDNYRVDEIDQFVDGQLTLCENIADNEGIKIAYRAYKSWTSEHKKEKKLPGLNYTAEQLFWISSANVWCAKYSPRYLNLVLNSDNHAPSMVRVNGQMSNQREFAADFSCPVGSKMNPKEKCLFW